MIADVPRCFISSRMRCTTWSPSLESSADVGSSNMTSSGEFISARPMATRCFWPPESWLGRLLARSSRPSSFSSWSARLRASERERPVGPSSSTTSRFSRAVRNGTRFTAWKTNPTRVRRNSVSFFDE